MVFAIICYLKMFPAGINAIENAVALQAQNQLFAKEVLTILPFKFCIF